LQAFIACSWGTEYIGYVLVCYGAVDALSSYSFGYVIKSVGRVPIFFFAATINATLLVVYFTWMPTGEENYVLFICAGLWGMADAVWQTQINGERLRRYRQVV
jgi:predicted MFS family arabinose efflux permease